MIIGRGTPISHSYAPFPNVIADSSVCSSLQG
jgi:hypothetical protein